MKFLHIADVHLGCHRYNLEERPQDFFRAWHDIIIRHALPNEVDFVLIAGDLFNSRKVDPQAMNHAMIGLQALKEANVPVLAIEGNHDQHDAVTSFSWLRSLSQWGLLKLLEPARYEENRVELLPWSEESISGSYIDVAEARIFGSHWYGMSANRAIPDLAAAIKEARSAERFNILMLHTDVEGQLSRPLPALSIARLKELRTLVDYVALGHTHKRFELENWAFNPGSPETVSIDEYREDRGVYLVEVEKATGLYEVRATHIRDYWQRPFQRLSFDVSGAEDAEAVCAGVMDKVRREARTYQSGSDEPAPIIEITLKGHLGFKNSLLDVNRMRDEASALTGALHVMVRNSSVPVEYAVAAGLDADTSRHERERRIVEDLIARDVRYKDRAGDIAALVIEAKRLALSDESPEKILDLIAQRVEPQPQRNVTASGVEAETEASPDAAKIPATALQAIERNATAL